VDEFRLRDLRFGRQTGTTCAALAGVWSLGLLIWDLMTPGGESVLVASTPLCLTIAVWLLLRNRAGWLGHLRWLAAVTLSLAATLLSLIVLVWGGFVVLPAALLLDVACLFMCPVRDGRDREPVTTSDLVIP
jgi:hypothetical protein